MNRIETPKSSNIKFVEHDGKNLYVEFKTGGRYKYDNVPVQVFETFRTAPSAGKYFISAIRNNYASTKLG